jgi:hypothetical protein
MVPPRERQHADATAACQESFYILAMSICRVFIPAVNTFFSSQEKKFPQQTQKISN